MITVLIVDDEPDVCDLVSFNLQRSGMSTLIARNGLDAVVMAKKHQPTAIVLDRMLPGLDGFNVFKELRLDSRTKGIPILMLTARAQLEDVIAGLELGADDYLTKPFSPKELVLRVHALIRRTRNKTGVSEIRSGKFLLDKNTMHFFLDGDPVDLTPTEFKLLSLLVEREGTPQQREDLLREVWGYRDAAQSRTLDTHMKRLREKLGQQADCIETIRGVGYAYRALSA
jgi:two-component system phosphate regulon response regulator PhoB